MTSFRILALSAITVFGSFLAFAQAEALAQAQAQTQPESLPAMIELKLDIRNLVSSSAKERISEERLKNLISEVNQIYSQCQVRFVTRNISEVAASTLQVSFPPQNENDLASIGAQLNPNGFAKTGEAFPLTIAGEFNFFAPTYQVNLYALTWAWLNGPNDINRLHSVIGRQHLDGSLAVEIIAHEFGHFFLLQHTGIAGNIMATGRGITADQCAQIRTVSETYYQGLR